MVSFRVSRDRSTALHAYTFDMHTHLHKCNDQAKCSVRATVGTIPRMRSHARAPFRWINVCLIDIVLSTNLMHSVALARHHCILTARQLS